MASCGVSPQDNVHVKIVHADTFVDEIRRWTRFRRGLENVE